MSPILFLVVSHLSLASVCMRPIAWRLFFTHYKDSEALFLWYSLSLVLFCLHALGM